MATVPGREVMVAVHPMSIDGVELHVEVDGEGPALVLVNGAFLTVRQWDGVIGELRDAFTVVRHDVRGTGRSGSGPPDGYRFERYADDLVMLCDRLGFDRFTLWGMAWGARVALVTAAGHADRIDRLVLSDLAIDPADPDAQRAGAAAAKQARAAAGLAEAPRPDGWRDHVDIDTTSAAMAATRHHPDLMPMVEQVQAPTLIATGAYDPNLMSSGRACGGLADGRLEELALTGHGSVLQRPDLVLEVVLGFLGVR